MDDDVAVLKAELAELRRTCAILEGCLNETAARLAEFESPPGDLEESLMQQIKAVIPGCVRLTEEYLTVGPGELKVRIVATDASENDIWETPWLTPGQPAVLIRTLKLAKEAFSGAEPVKEIDPPALVQQIKALIPGCASLRIENSIADTYRVVAEDIHENLLFQSEWTNAGWPEILELALEQAKKVFA